MKHYGLVDADVPGLHVIGAENWGMSLLRAAGSAPTLNQPGWQALESELDRTKPDILIIDPLVCLMGGVDGNNNSAAAMLMGRLVEVAAKRRIGVIVAHHTAKGRDPASAESAMGAASFVNLARIGLAIEPLAEQDAPRIGVPPWEAKFIFRVVSPKHNFSPPSDNDRYFRLVSVEMPNQQPPVYPNGDKVAVVEVFRPGVSALAYPPQLIQAALLVLDGANPPLSPSKRATGRYAAPFIAQAIAPHRGGQGSDTEAAAVLDHVIRSGLVVVQSVKIARPGSRVDTRDGLVLTPAGKAVIQQEGQVSLNNPPPQSPQPPASLKQGNAGGAPPGLPQRPRGCGGMRGEVAGPSLGSPSTSNEQNAPQKASGESVAAPVPGAAPAAETPPAASPGVGAAPESPIAPQVQTPAPAAPNPPAPSAAAPALDMDIDIPDFLDRRKKKPAPAHAASAPGASSPDLSIKPC
jgi:AAA domain